MKEHKSISSEFNESKVLKTSSEGASDLKVENNKS